MLKRLLAAVSAAALTLGLTVAFAAPASANSETCNSIGYQKPPALDKSSGDVTFEWGRIVWSGKTFTYFLNPGWTVDFCIKSGAQAGTLRADDRTGSGSITIVQDISHVGYKDPQYIPSRVDCTAATLVLGRPLTNGDHINMTVSQGGSVFQVNAYVDIRQAQDPDGGSGLVVRVTVPGLGQITLPLTPEQKASGTLVFTYSAYLTGSWTVRWVQFNDTYFNQANLEVNFFDCTGDEEIEITVAPSAIPPTCDADGSLVVPVIPHVTWTGGTHGAGPGVYTLVAHAEDGYVIVGQDTFPVTVLPKGEGLDCDELVTLLIDPYATPEECVPDSETGEKLPGTIVIVYQEHVTFEISSDLDGIRHPVTVTPEGNVPGKPGHNAFPYPAGDYHVWVTAEDGYVLEDGHDSFPLTIEEPELTCGLPTYAELPTFATWTHELCTPTGEIVPATVTVEPVDGVTYSLDGVVLDTASTSTFSVAPGPHVVEAEPDDPASTVTTKRWDFVIDAADTTTCGQLTTHPFTGSDLGGWLAFAAGLLAAGLALLGIRIIRRRAAHAG